MISCVIQNHVNLSSCMTTGHSETFEKSPKCIAIKRIVFFLVNKLSISNSYCSKISNTFSGWMMQQYRLFHFGRNPHPTSRPILLKMNFIHGPYIDVVVGNQPSGFFLNTFCSSSLARAINERGFLRRKSKPLNRRWHCRVPNVMPNSL
jgi:hypothetical protein